MRADRARELFFFSKYFPGSLHKSLLLFSTANLTVTCRYNTTHLQPRVDAVRIQAIGSRDTQQSRLPAIARTTAFL